MIRFRFTLQTCTSVCNLYIGCVLQRGNNFIIIIHNSFSFPIHSLVLKFRIPLSNQEENLVKDAVKIDLKGALKESEQQETVETVESEQEVNSLQEKSKISLQNFFLNRVIGHQFDSALQLWKNTPNVPRTRGLPSLRSNASSIAIRLTFF